MIRQPGRRHERAGLAVCGPGASRCGRFLRHGAMLAGSVRGRRVGSRRPAAGDGRPRVPLLEVVLELAAAGRMAELAQRLGLDLADAFAGDVELLADLFEGPGTPVLEAEPELQHAPLATGQRVQDRLDLLLEELVRRCLGGREGPAVLDEVT